MTGLVRGVALAAVCVMAFACSAEPLVVKQLEIDGSSYEYRTYRPSVPGRFLFTPRNKVNHMNSLVALDAGGGVLFQRPLRVNTLATDFKKIVSVHGA